MNILVSCNLYIVIHVYACIKIHFIFIKTNNDTSVLFYIWTDSKASFQTWPVPPGIPWPSQWHGGSTVQRGHAEDGPGSPGGSLSPVSLSGFGGGGHWLCCDMIYSYTLSCRVIAKVKKWSQSVTDSRLGFIDYVIYVMIYSNIIIHYTTAITKIKKCHNIWLLFLNKSWMSWEDYQI